MVVTYEHIEDHLELLNPSLANIEKCEYVISCLKNYKKFCVFTAVQPGIDSGSYLSESTMLSSAILSSRTAFAQLYDVVGHKLGRRYRTTWVLDAGPVVYESTTLSAHPPLLPLLLRYFENYVLFERSNKILNNFTHH